MRLLSLEDIHFGYGAGRGEALRGVSLEIRAGEVLALLGPNGCGKSTLLRIAAGILGLGGAGGQGRVLVDGEELAAKSPAWRARRVAYVSHDLNTEFAITAWEAVLMGRISLSPGFLLGPSVTDRERVREAMESCRCWSLRDRELRALSCGERQRVAIARALAQEARAILLDETLSQIDLDHQHAIGELLLSLADRGFSVVLVSHDLNLATEWAHACALLHEGRLVTRGPLRETLTEGALRELYPAARLFVSPNPRTGAPKVFLDSTRG